MCFVFCVLDMVSSLHGRYDMSWHDMCVLYQVMCLCDISRICESVRWVVLFVFSFDDST